MKIAISGSNLLSNAPRRHKGLAMCNDSDRVELDRKSMVRDQLARITDHRVLEAMLQVDRAAFVSPEQRSQAYGDFPLPIECGQTISQPFTVAYMCEIARIQEDDKVLEIGTGSGYGAAILSRLASEVHSVERLSTLAASAKDRLNRLGYTNVHVHHIDGSLGYPDEAPYNAIIVTAGAKILPEAYAAQLAEGGRIIIPIGTSPYSQTMYRFTRVDDRLAQEALGGFAFVPLIGEHGWPAILSSDRE